MLTILSKIFGPHRAVSIYGFLKTWGLLVVAIVGIITIAATLLVVNDDGTHEHDSYLTVSVLSATPVNGDLKYGVIASVQLPDGSATSINEPKEHIARTVGATACVEKRIYVISGEARYRFKQPSLCEANQ
ncbi:hypothetical protein RUE5091_03399 [Ruegeria denitrificans]|uniref:Uncharacterized protein n=1 Tax=Ruegeria denitrificans TaxID=1715692 RepID=A0A0P1IG42_9RHOB|nr:hypothetical protein [Ruegeria denitrificans]CUK11276.1 hypothetical protein RUE5091_03399 [Ruegeria denitrificans]